MENQQTTPCVIGLKQTAKAVRQGRAQRVLIASDCEERVAAPLRALCAQSGVPLAQGESMSELGRRFGIEVGAAAVAELFAE